MTLRTYRPGVAKKAKVVHWWAYDGVYKVACGKQYSQGDQPLKSTVDIQSVSCKMCLSIHKRKNHQLPIIGQVMATVR